MSEFDYDTYRDQLADTLLDAYRSQVESGTEPHTALTEAVFHAADEWVAHRDGKEAVALLDASPNEPTEWIPYAEGKTDWREVVKAMAFTVARQDAYDVLEDRDYLDEHREPTEKLEEIGSAEA